jgi:Zn-dependent peptidase ImmA (M78 family)
MAAPTNRMIIKNLAEKLALDHGFTSLPVCPKVIAEKSGISLQELPSDHPGVSGMLVRAGDEFGIMYATYVKSEGFRRFSIAHELGHYFLPGHPDAVLQNGRHISHAGFVSADRYEREADMFAAAMLMPERLFKKAWDDDRLTLEQVTKLATQCGTSVTATAFRFVELSKRAHCAVMSEGKSILSAMYSERMKERFKGLPYLKDKPVPAAALTASFNADPDSVAKARQAQGVSSISDWFGLEAGVALDEEVVGLGSYGRSLTLLRPRVTEEDDFELDDEADEEARLIESWEVRFRR